VSNSLTLPWMRRLFKPEERPLPPPPIPVVKELEKPSNLVWYFYDGDAHCPEWMKNYQYPITRADAECLLGIHVNVRFDYQWDEFPDGRKENYRPVRVVITDKNSDLCVQDSTFPLAAEAFISAARRMRLG